MKPGQPERFTPATIRRHLRKQFPGCPVKSVAEIAEWMRRLDARTMHIELTLVGIVNAHIRHRLTDYNRLLDKHKLTPGEARLIVQDEIDEIRFSWSRANIEMRKL